MTTVTKTKKRSSIIFITLGIFLALCVICLVASFAMDAMGFLPTPMPILTAQPAAATSIQSTSVPDSPASKYLQEYGGSEQAYLEILNSSDCKFLQEKFEIAYANNQLETPGTEAFRWTLGYMTAADDRLREIGCY